MSLQNKPWLQTTIAIAAPLITVGIAWGIIKTEVNQLNRTLSELTPLVRDMVKTQTILEQHISRGAHIGAHERIAQNELNIREIQVDYKNILKRIDAVQKSLEAMSRQQKKAK